MIIDNIKNLDKYLKNDDYLHKINNFIQKSKKEDLVEDRYSLDGDDLVAIIQKYETKCPEDCNFESHLEYVDIQYIERGQEVINWTYISNLKQSCEYNKERDIIFYSSSNETIDLKMKEDMFAIFLKHDGHRARCIMDYKCNIKKILFKIKINKINF